MKHSKKLAVTILSLLLITALVEVQSSNLYTQAKEAYGVGDCKLSIELFNKFKTKNEVKLKKHGGFLQQINDAINDCTRTPALGSYDKELIAYDADKTIDMVLVEIQSAIDAIDNDKSNEKVLFLIKQASDLSKEIAIDGKVYKARSKLKAAFAKARKSDSQEAGEELRDAKKRFEDLKHLF